MSVYVDNARIPYRRMKMCHMLADSIEELHAMADKIGVARKHFQSEASTPHYDICLEKRALAVAAGAIEATRVQIVQVMRELRMKAKPLVDLNVSKSLAFEDFEAAMLKAISTGSADGCANGHMTSGSILRSKPETARCVICQQIFKVSYKVKDRP